MLSKIKRLFKKPKPAEFEANWQTVEGIVVYCMDKENYTMCFRKKGTAINFKCSLCGSYVTNGEHKGCVLA